MTIHIALLGFAIHVNERRPYSEFAFLAAIHHCSLFLIYFRFSNPNTSSHFSCNEIWGRRGAGAQGAERACARFYGWR